MTKPNPADTMFLAPDDTIRVWDERGGLRTSIHWTDVQQAEHAAEFTVAKIAKLELLRRMQEALDTVIRDGGTYADFKRNLLPHLQAAGWWGKVTDPDLTGTSDTIIVNDRRLKNIYRTNVRMSIAAGRWRKFQREKDLFPYLRYVSNHYRKHPRADHQSWHGLILPIDDLVWQWMFPPNGWGCNCKVEQVSEARMKRNGWSVGTAPNPPMVRYETPNGPMFAPEGIAQGFAYNPGTAHLRVIAERAIAEIDASLAVGQDVAANIILREIIADPAFEQFAGMPEGVFPVAILTNQQRQLIGAQNRQVVLPAGVYQKQLGLLPEVSRGHPELTLDDYRMLPDLVDQALLVAQQDASRLIYFSDAQGRIWKVIVRQDEGDLYPVVVSFHRSRPRNIEPETRNLTILLDRRS